MGGFCLEGWKQLPDLAHLLLFHILGHGSNASASASSYIPLSQLSWTHLIHRWAWPLLLFGRHTFP